MTIKEHIILCERLIAWDGRCSDMLSNISEYTTDICMYSRCEIPCATTAGYACDVKKLAIQRLIELSALYPEEVMEALL